MGEYDAHAYREKRMDALAYPYFQPVHLSHRYLSPAPALRHAHSCDGYSGSGGYRHELADIIAEAEVGVLEARDANKVGQMRVR